ncbi:hypothetical protein COCNU_scaffold001336G000130 [Cocos nucifera]|nr:hypothetical protein [Cocos nucifera]
MVAMAISSVPTSSSANCTIMAIVGRRTMPLDSTPSMLIGLQSGLSAWTIVNKTDTFHDVIYYKESFYTAGRDLVLVFNAELKEVMGSRVPVYPCMSLWRLVESSGNLLMVKREVSASRKRILCRIYELSSLGGSLQIEKVDDLVDQIIFLGTHGRAVSLPAKDHPPRKAKIYIATGNILRDGSYWMVGSGLSYAIASRPSMVGSDIYHAIASRLSIQQSCWISPGDTATWHMPRLC